MNQRFLRTVVYRIFMHFGGQVRSGIPGFRHNFAWRMVAGGFKLGALELDHSNVIICNLFLVQQPLIEKMLSVLGFVIFLVVVGGAILDLRPREVPLYPNLSAIVASIY